ncbi:hypothetical protein [Nonlabens ulvanivorans]|uniref:hypothetical protein n=1 Tax=Nonlabens ulvanivorans TaxID=906888 RepID=UPI0029422593|nr:hypothetical protein [Nonlabens ulvanivorans]WOI22617.1 hypothetical protein R1T42_13210 [Nonlabens ulvanivorans]
MMELNKYFTFILALLLISCSTDEAVTYTVEQTPYDISEIKIYTKQGEVQNDTLITYWQDKQALVNPYQMDLYKDLNGTFSGINKVTTRFYQRMQTRTVIDRGDYEVWENVQQTNAEFWRFDMFKYQRLNDRTILDLDDPDDLSAARRIYNDCFFIEKDDTGEYLPITTAIYISRSDQYMDRNIIYNETNRYDPNFRILMHPNDTIIVQSYKLKLIRK